MFYWLLSASGRHFTYSWAGTAVNTAAVCIFVILRMSLSSLCGQLIKLSPLSSLQSICQRLWRHNEEEKKKKKDSGRWCFVAKPRRRRQGYRKQAGNCKSAIVRRRRHALRGLTFCWPRQGQKYCEPLLNHTMGNVKKKKMWTKESTASENVEFGQKYWDTEKIKIVQKILTIVLRQLKKQSERGEKGDERWWGQKCEINIIKVLYMCLSPWCVKMLKLLI